MTILVTGASGHLGRLAVQALVSRGADVVAGARTPSKVADLGVPVVELDYDRAETVTAALEGVDSVLLVSGMDPGARVTQHQTVIDAAKAAGVGHLVYTSAPRADTSDLILAPDHKATEQLIVASGIPFTILRNNWYHENYAGSAKQAGESGVLLSSAGEGRVASAARADYADAAAVVLVDPASHLGRTFELSGDVAWTFADLAAVIAEIAGRDVELASVNSEEHAAALAGLGLDAGTVGFVVGLDANIATGALDKSSDDLSTILGRPTTPLAEGLRAALA